MTKKLKRYQKLLYFSSIIALLGILYATVFRSTSGTYGIVMIGVACLFFIAGMAEKRKHDENHSTQETPDKIDSANQ